jgi:hypothetical protein
VGPTQALSDQPSFAGLIRRVCAGDTSAAAEVVWQYEPGIRRAVRVRLTDPRLRRAYGPGIR